MTTSLLTFKGNSVFDLWIHSHLFIFHLKFSHRQDKYNFKYLVKNIVIIFMGELVKISLLTIIHFYIHLFL